jgi:hypothetical protein
VVVVDQATVADGAIQDLEFFPVHVRFPLSGGNDGQP